jgi:transcriptional regulator with XRE-family HTH domain
MTPRRRYRLRELLDARGMSANELHRRSGVSGLTLTNMMRGRTEAVDRTLERLAAALGVTVDGLIDDPAPEGEG